MHNMQFCVGSILPCEAILFDIFTDAIKTTFQTLSFYCL